METGYTAVYLTQGMPAEFDADKRIWFRVGVKAQNMTDEDIIVYLTVENAEIRGRSSDENSPDSITFEAEILEIRDGYFLVKPEAGWAINSAALLEVPMENMEPSPALQVGDVIEITYDGRILETDPGRSARVPLESTAILEFGDRKSTRLNSSHRSQSRMPSSA